MPPQWSLGQQQGPGVGERFQQAFDAGIQRQDQQALRGYQQEQRVEQAQARTEQRQTQATERQREEIRLGARIVRQINPQDDAGWQRARATAAQAGIDVSQVPPTFDPAYRDQLLAAGQALEPQQQQQGTTLQRDYEYLQRTDPRAASRYLRRQTEPQPRVIIGPNGQPFMVQGEDDTQAAAPTEIENPQTGQRMRLNPATNQWEPVQGGPTQSGSGTFPW